MLTNAAALRRLLFGALHTGSLLQLNSMHHLPTVLAIQAREWLEIALGALAKVIRKTPNTKRGVANRGSRASTPAPPPSQKDGGTSFQPILEQDSSSILQAEDPKSPGIRHRSNFTSSPQMQNSRSLETPTASVVSQQSSQHSFTLALSRQSHLTNQAFTRNSSRSTVRLDWYQMIEEGTSDEVGPGTWFGYGGEARRPIELDKSPVLRVSPAFGCILVGGTAAETIPMELKVSLTLVLEYSGLPPWDQ